METAADPEPMIDGGALHSLLAASGLVDVALAAQVGELAGEFPAIVERNLFLEFELSDCAAPAGFGFGFPAGALDRLRAVDHAFLLSPRGRPLRAALADDPFAADHCEHLNLFGDADPDWVEYDISDGRLAEVPFVFFRLPSRFRQVSQPAEVAGLCAALPGGASGDFEALMQSITLQGPAAPYRIGVARGRGFGWWRAIITELGVGQVQAALEGLEPLIDVRPLEAAAQFYASAMDQSGARFALSVDIQDGRVTAVDVECPYLFRVADPCARRAPLIAFLQEIVAAGLVSHSVAGWIADQAVRELAATCSQPGLRSQLHHLKFRLFGEPRPRIKAYLLLELLPGRQGGAA